ncbi:MAG: RNA degradosome polyphosphate kinase, partial [Synergistaceae bacterium]|nr:RNA degradosome polyphosphate kinase [Synergistaceae bacterium]
MEAAEGSERDESLELGAERRYFNRELSWVRFNRRVLDEALDKSKPLLERIKFLAIFSNNLDEFFMIRVSGLCRQYKIGVPDRSPDGMSASEQLAAIRRGILPDLKRQLECWHSDIMPELKKNCIELLSYKDLKDKQKKYLDSYFKKEIFPTLTPLAFDPGHPFPHISGLSLNLALVLKDDKKRELFARLKIPESFPRLLQLPADSGDKDDKMEKMGLH